jgi:hypothetical protein
LGTVSVSCGDPLTQDGVVSFIADLEIEAASLPYLSNKEGFTMNHVTRLRLIGRVTYYIGWIALVCGGLFHLNIATKQFQAVGLPQRNLLEISVVCFLICIASEVRAQASPGNDLSAAPKRAS